jgi:hypothetical protein
VIRPVVEVKARSNRDAPGFRLFTLPYAYQAVDDYAASHTRRRPWETRTARLDRLTGREPMRELEL